MKPMNHSGLALAVSLSATINLILLLIILRVRLGRLGIKNILYSLGKVVLASVIMGGVVFYFNSTFSSPGVIPLLISIFLGITFFAVCAYILRCAELLSLWELIKSGKNKQ